MAADRSDPLYQYILMTRLQPYIPKVREWWANRDKLRQTTTGAFGIPGAPPGLMYRFTRSAKKSPILNVQAFPFVPSAFLQITAMPGGVVKMVKQVCLDAQFHIDEFVIIEKDNLPSTYSAGQILCFIPDDIYQATKEIGQWIYVTELELMHLATGTVPETIQVKARLRV